MFAKGPSHCDDVGYKECISRSKGWEFPKQWQVGMKAVKSDSKAHPDDKEKYKTYKSLSSRYNKLKKQGSSKSKSSGKGEPASAGKGEAKSDEKAATFNDRNQDGQPDDEKYYALKDKLDKALKDFNAYLAVMEKGKPGGNSKLVLKAISQKGP